MIQVVPRYRIRDHVHVVVWIHTLDLKDFRTSEALPVKAERSVKAGKGGAGQRDEFD